MVYTGMSGNDGCGPRICHNLINKMAQGDHRVLPGEPHHSRGMPRAKPEGSRGKGVGLLGVLYGHPESFFDYFEAYSRAKSVFAMRTR